jgi:signal recognition particle receptor subunit beta
MSEWVKLFFKVMHILAPDAVDSVIKRIPEWIAGIKGWWTGKTIAIIGPTASGKNSMFSRLQHHPIPTEHVQTRGAEKVENFNVKWTLAANESVDFKCKRALNIGGEVDERERFWPQACEEADVIFYLLDSKKFKEEEKATLQRFREDMRWLKANLRHFKPTVSVHLLLNKIDLSFGPDVYADVAKDAMKGQVSIVEEIAEETLGDEFKRSRVTGVTPISMADSTLFGIHFSAALSQIAELKKK